MFWNIFYHIKEFYQLTTYVFIKACPLTIATIFYRNKILFLDARKIHTAASIFRHRLLKEKSIYFRNLFDFQTKIFTASMVYSFLESYGNVFHFNHLPHFESFLHTESFGSLKKKKKINYHWGFSEGKLFFSRTHFVM